MLSQVKPVRVLIVEDEVIIGWDIANAVEEAGCEALGPAGSVEEALALLEAGNVRAAICDVNLPDGDIGPVLEALAGDAIPVVMHTGAGLPNHLRRRFSHVLVCKKPTDPAYLAQTIKDEIAKL